MWNVMPCLVFLSYVAVKSAISVLVSMKGTEFITYDVLGSSRNSIHTEKLEIVFKFKTIDPSALLIFSVNTLSEDYISLELLDGKLRYKVRLGHTDDSEGALVVGNNLNDYKWHNVNINLNQQNVSFRLDSRTTFKRIGGPFKGIHLNHKVYFGGVADGIDISNYKLTSRKYYGCLENLFFNNEDILYQTKYNNRRFKITGDLLWSECEEVNYVPITFRHPQDYSLLPTFQTESLSISFKFRTYIAEGLLFSKISNKLSVSLFLSKGVLVFKVRVTGQAPLIIPKGKNLDDGIWHRVDFMINHDHTKFKLDRYDEVTHRSILWQKYIIFKEGNATLGGGAEDIMPGFVGCMYDIWIDNSNVFYDILGDEYLYGGIPNMCELQDRCLFTPCKHGGRCTQTSLSFSCDCTFTLFGGEFCEKAMHQPSCQAYKDLGLHEDAYCIIDPDGDGEVAPARVLCNMTQDSKKAVTVYKHNLDQRDILVSKGKKVQGMYFEHTFDYGLTLDDFDVFLQDATTCRQYVQFKCKNTYLLRSPNGPLDTAVWSGRMGSAEDYWGGAEPDSGKCACAKSKICADNRTDIFCNCDAGDGKWREDSGYFKEIERLPVSQLRFKFTANESFFTVGDLECQYNSTKIPVRFSKERILTSCKLVNQPTPGTTPLFKIPKEQKIIPRDQTVAAEPSKKASTSHPGVPFRPTVYVPPIKEREDDKGVEVSITAKVLKPVIITIGVVCFLVFVYFMSKLFLSRRRESHMRSSPEYQEYEEESNMCSLFFRTSRNLDHQRETVQSIDRAYDKNALLELKYTHTRAPPQRVHIDEDDILDSEHSCCASSSNDTDSRRINDTLHIDMNYKRRKKRFGAFF